jgi:hypothetical protein
MDALRIIDQLDELLHNAKSVPLTNQVRVDRDEVYDLLDQLRATLPEEIAAARAIVAGLTSP